MGEKIGRLLPKKIGPTDFQVTPTDFFFLNRPTTTDFSIFVCLWKSVRKIVWWELGFRLLSQKVVRQMGFGPIGHYLDKAEYADIYNYILSSI